MIKIASSMQSRLLNPVTCVNEYWTRRSGPLDDSFLRAHSRLLLRFLRHVPAPGTNYVRGLKGRGVK